MKASKVTVAVAAGLISLAPLPSMAEGGFYGSVRIGFGFSDDGNESTFEFRNWASRMGYEGSTELAGGMKAFGKYEFGVDPDSANLVADIITRKAYVGLEGVFGTFIIGQNYHTFYNNVIAPVDQPWWGSCNGCVSYTGRTANALTWEGEFGTVKGGATLYLEPDAASADGEDDIDGIEIGGTFNVGPVDIGVGIQDLADAEDPTVGVAVSGEAGPINYASNVSINGDTFGVDVFAAYSNYYLDIGFIDYDTAVRTDTVTGLTFGYTLDIGENTLAWFEASASDSSAAGADVNTALRAALKFDWK